VIEPPPSVDPIVEAFAAVPGLPERLLAEHTDDGTGRCRVCTNGPQAGRQIHPCRLYEIAEQASQLTPGGPR
jgi:hypothetical protein